MPVFKNADVYVKLPEPSGPGCLPMLFGGLVVIVFVGMWLSGEMKSPPPPPPDPCGPNFKKLLVAGHYAEASPAPQLIGHQNGREIYSWRGRRWAVDPLEPQGVGRWPFLCDLGSNGGMQGLRWCYFSPPGSNSRACVCNATGDRGWCG